MSTSVADFMSSIHMYVGTSTAVLMVGIPKFILVISWSWFSMLLWHNSQSHIYNSGTSLYKNVHTALVYMQHDALQML